MLAKELRESVSTVLRISLFGIILGNRMMPEIILYKHIGLYKMIARYLRYFVPELHYLFQRKNKYIQKMLK